MNDGEAGRRRAGEAAAGAEVLARRRAATWGPRLLLIKAVLLVGLAVAGGMLARVPGVREWFRPAGAMMEWVDGLGWMGPPVFVGISAGLIAVGVPRLVFCPIAGAAFGFPGGLLTTTVATMLAYFGTFLFLRGRLADREEPPELPAMVGFLRYDPGLAGVILTRLLPIPGLLGTVALSLSPVRKRAFFAGSLIGLMPEAVPLILLGAGVIEARPRHWAWWTGGGVVLVGVCLGLIRHLLRRHARVGGGETRGDGADSRVGGKGG